VVDPRGFPPVVLVLVCRSPVPSFNDPMNPPPSLSGFSRSQAPVLALALQVTCADSLPLVIDMPLVMYQRTTFIFGMALLGTLQTCLAQMDRA
jgi:hypothetical protein